MCMCVCVVGACVVCVCVHVCVCCGCMCCMCACACCVCVACVCGYRSFHDSTRSGAACSISLAVGYTSLIDSHTMIYSTLFTHLNSP